MQTSIFARALSISSTLILMNGCALAVDEPMERDMLESKEQDVLAPNEEDVPIPSEQVILESREEAPVAESQESLSVAQGICIGAITLGAGLGCRAAALACASTTAITVGGTAYLSMRARRGRGVRRRSGQRSLIHRSILLELREHGHYDPTRKISLSATLIPVFWAEYRRGLHHLSRLARVVTHAPREGDHRRAGSRDAELGGSLLARAIPAQYEWEGWLRSSARLSARYRNLQRCLILVALWRHMANFP